MDLRDNDHEWSEEGKNCYSLIENNKIIKNFEKISNIQEHIGNDTVTNTQNVTENELNTLEQENSQKILINEQTKNETILKENQNDSEQVCLANNNIPINNSDKQNDLNLVLSKEKEKTGKDNLEQQENEHDIQKEQINIIENECTVTNDGIAEHLNENSYKNYRNVILEDWEVETPQIIANCEPHNEIETVVQQEEQQAQFVKVVDPPDKISLNSENCILVNEVETNNVEVLNESTEKDQNSEKKIHVEDVNTGLGAEIVKLMSETKVESLKYSKSVSNDDIVRILDESQEKIVKPIVTRKDLFFSIELTKRLNQNLAHKKAAKNLDVSEKSNIINKNDNCSNNNLLDERQKIVEILEADDIKDWKSVPTKSDNNVTENGNDNDISKVIKNLEEAKSLTKKSLQNANKISKKKTSKIDKELARTIALQQLREEFSTTRKRSKTTKKVNQIPFLASTAFEKALTSPEVTTALKPGPPRRRPCYLPENISNLKNNDASKNLEVESQTVDNNNKINKITNETIDDSKKNSYVLDLDLDASVNSSISKNVVKTYVAKRKSTDTESEIKSTLETIAAVTKALNENSDDSLASKPKKRKTVIKSCQSRYKKERKGTEKLSTGQGSQKRNLELEKLLGDEGAVRMLYETQHGESSSLSPKKTKNKTSTRLKQDLLLKTKLVKNAVIRLSGGAGAEGVFLRGNRRSKVTKLETKTEPLFDSTPNVVFHKTKKKQRADASRILYRHSSSESFDSSEGYRRTSFDADLSTTTSKEESTCINNKPDFSSIPEKIEEPVSKTKPKSEVIIKKKLKWLQNSKKNKKILKTSKSKNNVEKLNTYSSTNSSKLNLFNVPVRKSSRPRMISKKYSVWSSTSMDSLSVESLGLKKLKKPSPKLGKKLNCKELTILEYENFVQVILNPVSVLLKNSFNVQVLQELTNVFVFLSKKKSCKAILLSSSKNFFCQGIDINYIISLSDSERKHEVKRLVLAIEKFCNCLWDFKKPIIAGVQGAAVGLGVTILPYCDLVIASEKASFYTPYVRLGQAPEGAPTYTFPGINRLLVSELLFKNHKITASDALSYGLITQVISEDRFEDDIITVTRNMAAQNSQGIKSLKILLRNNKREEIAGVLRAEKELLKENWCNTICLNNMVKFLQSEELLVKQLDTT